MDGLMDERRTIFTKQWAKSALFTQHRTVKRNTLYAYDMVWVDEWRGDRVRSRLCVRQFKAEGLRNDLFAGTRDTFSIKYLL